MRFDFDLASLVTGVALLAGCALPAHSSSRASPAEPDCSFRSPVTCWTMRGRFPPPRGEARDSVPSEVQEQPPGMLARADTAGR